MHAHPDERDEHTHFLHCSKFPIRLLVDPPTAILLVHEMMRGLALVDDAENELLQAEGATVSRPCVEGCEGFRSVHTWAWPLITHTQACIRTQ